mgnify:CR=1 FL=1
MKLSIIIATYKRAYLLREALFSVINQSFTDFECLVIDDDFDAESERIVSEIAAKDKRFTYHKRPSSHQKGLPGCRNFGLSLANGDWIHFVDDDDLLHPLHFDLKFNAVQKFPRANYIVSKLVGFTNADLLPEAHVTDETAPLTNILQDYLTSELRIYSCAVLWQKEIFENHLFDESLKFSEEWDLYWRIFSTEIQGVALNAELYYRRQHEDSNSGRFLNRNKTEIADYIKTRNNAVNELVRLKLMNETLWRYFWKFSKKWKSKSMRDVLLSNSYKTMNKTIAKCLWHL